MVLQSLPRLRVAAIAASVLASLLAIPVAPAAADPDCGSQHSPRVVATGLNNPRHVRWSSGGLYVAEAGHRRRRSLVIPGAEGRRTPNCYGMSGSITRIKNHHQWRVVKGLPSLAPAGGTNALGPADVRVHGRSYVAALGLGANPTERAHCWLPKARSSPPLSPEGSVIGVSGWWPTSVPTRPRPTPTARSSTPTRSPCWRAAAASSLWMLVATHC